MCGGGKIRDVTFHTSITLSTSNDCGKSDMGENRRMLRWWIGADFGLLLKVNKDEDSLLYHVNGNLIALLREEENKIQCFLREQFFWVKVW